MADWPREIRPEDRIKYLIQARVDFRDQVEWTRDGPMSDYFALTPQEEALSVYPKGDGWAAVYSFIGDTDDRELNELGNFPTAIAARKAVADFAVVIWAVRQAWEDVGG